MKILPNTRIMVYEDRDKDFIDKVMGAEWELPASNPNNYTEGWWDFWDRFAGSALVDPTNPESGLNTTGAPLDLYKVKNDVSDIEGYLIDKMTGGNGITLDVSTGSNKVISVDLDLHSTDESFAHSLIYNSFTLKQIKNGTGINIISNQENLEIGIDEAFLEGITYGIKYAWADETEMLAEVGMGDADLGVRNDLGEVWKYNVDTWEYFFDLGTSTTEHTIVSSVTTESFSGSKTTQQGVNEENVSELGNIYNILEGNSPAFGDLRGAGGSSPDDLPIVPSQSVPSTETVATWTTLKQSSNEDTWEFNDTTNEILIKKAGFYTWNTQIELTNNSSLTRFLVFSTRNKNDNTEVFYTREVSVSRDGVTTQSSITFEVPEDDTTMEITIQGHDSAGNPNDDLTITDWDTSLLLNFVLNPISGTTSYFPIQMLYTDEVNPSDGEFNVDTVGANFNLSNIMFTDKDGITSTSIVSILKNQADKDSLVISDSNGNKSVVVFNKALGGWISGTKWVSSDFTLTGNTTFVVGEKYDFQFMKNADVVHSSSDLGITLTAESLSGDVENQQDINIEFADAIKSIDTDDIQTLRVMGFTYNAQTITNKATDYAIDVNGNNAEYKNQKQILWDTTSSTLTNTSGTEFTGEFNISINCANMKYDVSNPYNETDSWISGYIKWLDENGSQIQKCATQGSETTYSGTNGDGINTTAKWYKTYDFNFIYTIPAGGTLKPYFYCTYTDGTQLKVQNFSMSIVELKPNVTQEVVSETRFLSTYEATYDGTGYPIVPTSNGEVRWTFSAGNVIFNIFKENIDGETVYNLSNITVGDLVSLWVLDNPTSRVFEVDGFTDNGTYWTITGQNKTNSGTFVDGDKIVIEFEPSGGGTDENVKISDTDTTAGKLIDKISAGSNVTITTVNENGDEKLLITSSGEVSSIVKQGVNYYNLGSDICNNVSGVGQEIVNISSVNSNGTAWLMKSANGNVLTDIPTVANVTYADGLSPAIPILDNTKAIQMKLRTGNCRVFDTNRNDKTGIAYVEINVFELDDQSIISTNHTLVQTVQLMDVFGANNASVVGSGQTSNSYVSFELTNLNGIFTLDSAKQYGFTISGTADQNPPTSVEKIHLMDTAILTIIYEGEVL